MSNSCIQDFSAVFNLKSLIKEPIKKNLKKPTGSDHILTKYPKCFQYSSSYETGLFDIL